jgi:hypothetical protein
MKRSPSPSQRSSRDRMALGADRARSVPECSILFHIWHALNIIDYYHTTSYSHCFFFLKHRSSRQAISSNMTHIVSLCFIRDRIMFHIVPSAMAHRHSRPATEARKTSGDEAGGLCGYVVKRRRGTERQCRRANKDENGDTARGCGGGAADSGRQGRREVEMYRV